MENIQIPTVSELQHLLVLYRHKIKTESSPKRIADLEAQVAEYDDQLEFMLQLERIIHVCTTPMEIRTDSRTTVDMVESSHYVVTHEIYKDWKKGVIMHYLRFYDWSLKEGAN